eukprot:GHVN01068911.1.p1 GENE.GHVN01068911.1~~GHVN01068911.1.p1  ORF type:complete len:1098 (-),score=96.29 GHVN01068911.1:1412-4705(-)
MFVARFLDHKLRKAAEDASSSESSTGVAKRNFITKQLNDWLPKRPPLEFLLKNNVLPDPSRWSPNGAAGILNVFLKNVLLKRGEHVSLPSHLEGGNKPKRPVFTIRTELLEKYLDVKDSKRLAQSCVMAALHHVKGDLEQQQVGLHKVESLIPLQLETERLLHNLADRVNGSFAACETSVRALVDAKADGASRREAMDEIWKELQSLRILGEKQRQAARLRQIVVLSDAARSCLTSQPGLALDILCKMPATADTTLIPCSVSLLTARLGCLISALTEIYVHSANVSLNSMNGINWGSAWSSLYSQSPCASGTHIGDDPDPNHLNLQRELAALHCLERLDTVRSILAAHGNRSVPDNETFINALSPFDEVLARVDSTSLNREAVKLETDLESGRLTPGEFNTELIDPAKDKALLWSQIHFLSHIGPPEKVDIPRADISSSWAMKVLAGKTLLSFRYHFMRADSPMCLMDRPEWGFRYMLENFSHHLSILRSTAIWPTPSLQPFSEFDPFSDAEASQSLAIEYEVRYGLAKIDAATGLGRELAEGVRQFTFSRMPLLIYGTSWSPTQSMETIGIREHSNIIDDELFQASVSTMPAELSSEEDRKAIFLHTMQSLIDLQKQWKQIDRATSHVLLADFDLNTPVPKQLDNTKYISSPAPLVGARACVPDSSPPTSTERDLRSLFDRTTSQSNATTSMTDRLTSAVKSTIQLGAVASNTSLRECDGNAVCDPQKLGLLDYWASVDGGCVMEQVEKSSGNFGAIKATTYGATQSRMDGFISELATTIVDLLRQTADRIQGLTTRSALGTYCKNVLGPPIAQLAEITRFHWNELENTYEQGSVVALLMESLMFVENYMVHDFGYTDHLSDDVGELTSLCQRMIERLGNVYSIEALALAKGKGLLRTTGVFEDLIEKFTAIQRHLSEGTFLRLSLHIANCLDGFLLDFLRDHVASFHKVSEKENFLHNCKQLIQEIHNLACAALKFDEKLDPPAMKDLFPKALDVIVILSLPHDVAKRVTRDLQKIQEQLTGWLKNRNWETSQKKFLSVLHRITKIHHTSITDHYQLSPWRSWQVVFSPLPERLEHSLEWVSLHLSFWRNRGMMF